MPSLFRLLLAVFGVARGDLSFIAIGDWGGEDDAHPTTESQKLTALGMQSIANDLDADFALLMGDNIYYHGVACSAESSSRFRETFADVYTNLLPKLPFYVLAGNHDYGQGAPANVSAQVAYSALDAQWRFPHLWYNIHREFTSGAHTRTLDILVIDTVVLCGNGPDNEAFINDQLRSLWPGDRDLGSQALRDAVAEEQWAWLEQQLETSTADFLWVAGHYPIWSVGIDGSQQCLIDRLRPMLMKYGAHYISGHDHMLEHFQYDGLNTFVAGAGKECCYPVVNLEQIPDGAMRYVLAGEDGQDLRVAEEARTLATKSSRPVYGGFISLRFTADHASVTLHADSGDELYTAPPIPPRGRQHFLLHADSGDELYTAPPIPPRGRQYFLPVQPAAICIIIIAVVAACLPLLSWTFQTEKRHRKGHTESLLDSAANP